MLTSRCVACALALLTAPTWSAAQDRPFAEALGLAPSRPRIPDGLVVGGDCPAPGPGADQDIAAAAEAAVPLKQGLTLLELWKPTPSEEYECLTQVRTVDREGIVISVDCNRPGSRRSILQRTCRADLAAARMLHTQVGTATVIGEDGEELPETVVGSTKFSLSRAQFAALKRTREIPHHYVQIGSSKRLDWEAKGTLRLEAADRARITVNDSVVEVPVLRASGDATFWMWGRAAKGRLTAVVVDDERFPLLVDYAHRVDGSAEPEFRLHFPKVTYPSESTEGALLERGRLVVHGIYFDFNSDRIRKESDPVLKEIGEALARHPDWTITINGHTDNVGGDAYNLKLSQRRAEAVTRALVERHGIAAARLRSSGMGAGSPIEPNDTPEGRARNRRVELVRVEDAPKRPRAR